MKVRKVNQQLVSEAERVMAVVADHFGITVDVIQSKNTLQNVTYARKMAVYAIRNQTMIQRDIVSGMVGWTQPHYVSKVYREVMDRIHLDSKLRGDVQSIERKLCIN